MEITTSTGARSSRTFWRALLLIFGVFCGSSAVIMIRASTEHPFLVASFRLFVAALALSPFFFRELRNFSGAAVRRQIGWAVLPAVALAAHFMSWIVGARMTLVTNAGLVVNLTPVAMPFFLWLFYRERVNRFEIIGSFGTLAGLLLLSASTLRLSKTYFWGDMICFGSMMAMACYLALGRKNGQRVSLWLYMVPLYAIAGLICLICALPLINPIKPYSLENILYILALGLVPTVFGHTIFNYSLKHFRGQVVSVTNLAQPIFSGILGFLIFGELPPLIFYPAAAIILASVVIVLYSGSVRR